MVIRAVKSSSQMPGSRWCFQQCCCTGPSYISFSQQSVPSRGVLAHFPCRERPRIRLSTLDVAGLRGLPDGTFGREYMRFLEDNVSVVWSSLEQAPGGGGEW